MRTPLERFLTKFQRGSKDECWTWTAAVKIKHPGLQGYGHFWTGQKLTGAHRFAYEIWVGPIPDGLYIDHLCRNTLCVNPAHMEPVTNAENIRRGFASRDTGHCPKGHEFTPENTRHDGKGRRCRACSRETKRAYYLAKAPSGANTGAGSGVIHKRKTHCPKGHPYDEANTAYYKGERSCRTCHRDRQRERVRRQRLQKE